MQFTGDLVVASPDVLQVALGSDAEFLLLASDGLWDYMNRFGSHIKSLFHTQLLSYSSNASMNFLLVMLNAKKVPPCLVSKKS